MQLGDCCWKHTNVSRTRGERVRLSFIKKQFLEVSQYPSDSSNIRGYEMQELFKANLAYSTVIAISYYY